MDRIQLAILLRKYEQLLQDAHDAAEHALPDELKQERPISFQGTFLLTPALDELRVVIRLIGDDCDRLEAGELQPG